MKPIKLNLGLSACVIAGLFAAPSAFAVPVAGPYVDDPTNCDNPGPITLSHELGPTASGFPINEGLLVSVNASADPGHFGCVGDDGVPNEYSIRITNVSGIEWENLFFVADLGFTPGNFDGLVDDAAFGGAAFAEAFRIDGTVTPGINNPLINEDMNVDEVLEIGETWTFLIDNWSDFNPPTFGSVGKFADSSQLSSLSTASILATPVPEPASLTLLSIATLALLKKGRSR